MSRRVLLGLAGAGLFVAALDAYIVVTLMPAMVANSEAGNCERYTRLVEEGYRRFWRDYCASTVPE